jgi:hypothetical protein
MNDQPPGIDSGTAAVGGGDRAAKSTLQRYTTLAGVPEMASA